MTVFHGTIHNDVFDESGDTGSDTFDLYKGGEDTVIAGSGDDIINMGASLDAGDRLNGGAGRDVVTLKGDYSAGLVFDDQTIQNIEALQLRAGFNYNLTTADGNVEAGQTLGINASKLGAGNSLTFDGSAETDGHFVIYGGAGDDTLTGGAKADVFHLEKGGSDTAHGGGGNDTFYMGAALTSGDSIDGGTGNDMLSVTGGGTIASDQIILTSVETMTLDDHNWNITAGNTAVGSGLTLNVDASAITASHTLTFDGSGETNGSFNFEFGANFNFSDSITGGTGDDTATFNGNYASLVFAPASAGGELNSVETLQFLGSHAYLVSVTDDITLGGATLTLDAHTLAGGSNFNVDLTSATTSQYVIDGGGGNDGVTFADNFVSDGFVGGKSVNDFFDGGSGDDTLSLEGSYGSPTATVEIHANSLSSVETITLGEVSSDSYNLTFDDGVVADGATMTVNGSFLNASEFLSLDGSSLTHGNLDLIAGAGSAHLVGGAGDDFLTGSGNNDSLLGGGGDDVLRGGAGNDDLVGGTGNNQFTGGAGADILDGTDGTADTFNFIGASDSTGTNFDTIIGFNALNDHFAGISVGGALATNPTAGSISSANFDADVNALADSVLDAGHHVAIISTNSGGSYFNQTFVVIDTNGDNHYTTGTDYIVDITGYTGTLTIGDFTT